MSMKTILCFGDSNTWGYDPVNKGRHDYEDRWVTVLGRELGSGYLVIPEGLNGRTSTFDDPVEGDKNGRRHLPMLLESHAPLDLVVIMLGTNDLKRRYSAPAADIAAGVGRLVQIVQKSEAGRDGEPPRVLVLVPAVLQPLTNLAAVFEGGTETSYGLESAYQAMCEERGVPCVAIGNAVKYSELDGIHLDADGQRALGSFVAPTVKRLLE